MASVLVVVASSFDPGKSCTLLDHAPRCGESRTTSPCHRDVKKVSSLSAPRIACHDIRGLLGPYDRLGQLC
jgi:hypothetical protein